jgi:hypothetical protein
VRIFFAPSSDGTHAAQLVIRSDAANAPELAIGLRGTGQAPRVCKGVVCERPPGPCFLPAGTCNDGACRYTPRGRGASCDDSNPCTERDLCDGAGGCAGATKPCEPAPNPVCAGVTAQRVFHAPGVCGKGGCTFPSSEVPCPDGCEPSTGQCKTCQPLSCRTLGRECGPGSDGCGGALSCGACTTPPTSECVDSQTRRSYGAPGTCTAAGKCRYVFTDLACPSGCAVGRCESCQPTTCAAKGVQCGPLDDGCGGTLGCGGCGTASAPACTSATTSRTFSLPGSCTAGGTCTFVTQDTACPGGCDAATGRCKVCVPATCQALGKNCGTLPDGCGGTLNCGTTCPTGQTCGGGGVANVCGPAGSCVGSCSSLFDCTGPGLACDRAKGCCVPCGGSGQTCCVDRANLKFVCNSASDVCGRSSGTGASETYYCCKNQGNGCCSQGGCSGGTCCKCPRNGLNFCVQPSFGCGGC